MNTKSINTVIKYTAFVLILATLFVPTIVTPSMFFLFITGKALAFRILVEVIFALWLILALRDKSYLPRRSWVLGAVALFTLIVGIADVAGVEPLRSIWSNYERMEGFVWIAHLFLFFVATAGIIGGGKQTDQTAEGEGAHGAVLWFWFGHVALLASLIIGVHGLSQLGGQPAGFRIDSYLGNSTYLGVYALVHFFLAFLFWFRNVYHIHHARTRGGEWKTESILQLVGYTAIGFFNLYVMYNTGTRGSFVGLACGLALVALLIALREKTHKVIRVTGIALLGLVVAAVFTLGLSKNTAFVKSSSLLTRFSALATFDVKGVLSNEGKARSILWGIAFDGFKENPMLGWGQDNFGYVFTKHYDPAMYGQETWFDRTHNVIFDWLISAGLLGLLSYLSLFGAILYYLWRKNSGFELYESTVFTGLLAAYFVHNLFVFDNLSSYIVFFSLLAYVHSVGSKRALIPIATAEKISKDPVIVNYIYVPIVVVLAAASIYFVNIPDYKANTTLIQAMRACQTKNYTEADKLFAKSLGYNAYVGTAEITEQFVTCAASIINNTSLAKEMRQSWLDVARAALDGQISVTPDNTRAYVSAGSFFTSINNFPEAEKYFEKAVETAPGKQQPMISLALVYLNSKQVDKGLALLDKVYKNTPPNDQLNSVYASALIYAGKDGLAVELFGATSSVMTSDQVIGIYESRKQYSKVIDAYRARAAATPDDVRAAILPGVFYFKIGEKVAAVREFRIVAAQFPEFAKEIQSVIDSINAGKDPFAEPSATGTK